MKGWCGDGSSGRRGEPQIMPNFRRPGPAAVVALTALLAAGPAARGDTVTLKNGLVYRGTVDKDDTVVSVFDGLRRIIFHDTKVARTEADSANRGGADHFTLIQPLEKHGGQMPAAAVGISATPWDDNGRRTFDYRPPGANRNLKMGQALYDLGPSISRYRGIDGFWQGPLATNQVPRRVIIGLINRGEAKTNVGERTKLCRFLIQAEWYEEAIAELDGLARDFPETRETVRNTKQNVLGLWAGARLAEVDVRRGAQQPQEVAARLRDFPTRGAPAEILAAVKDQLAKVKVREADDRALADGLAATADALPADERKAVRPAVAEILRVLSEAPDAARSRLDPFARAQADVGKIPGPSEASDAAQSRHEPVAKAQADPRKKRAVSEAADAPRSPSAPSAARAQAAPEKSPGERLALAISGWTLGPDAAVADLPTALEYWEARGVLLAYLQKRTEDDRGGLLGMLQDRELPGPGRRRLDIDAITRLAQQLPPPLRDDKDEPGRAKLYRVLDDPNPDPTEYTVLLPPEYHPARSYPAIVALHNGLGMTMAIDWWAREATRRGYIVIAPEYAGRGAPVPGADPDARPAPDYRYTPAEHAAVELSLRDARKRFAIDGDRVFLGGQGNGGDMAWDFGLGHPDLFAGVAAISGIPAKYALAYHRDRDHANDRRLPLYIALGDLAGAGESVLDIAKDMITRNLNVTYVEYFHRGRDNLPEEAPSVFDWMGPLRRDPVPRKFAAMSARECDNRFFGIVIQEFAPGLELAPEAVLPLGQNLKPATIGVTSSTISNLLNIKTAGLRRFDVWVSPKLLDFAKPMEVRVNGKKAFKGRAKPDLDRYLEDLRIRGDRQQAYWLKVPVKV